jgi:hypothetical protein
LHDERKLKSTKNFYSPTNLIDNIAQGTSQSMNATYVGKSVQRQQSSPPRQSFTLEQIYMQKLERAEIIGNNTKSNMNKLFKDEGHRRNERSDNRWVLQHPGLKSADAQDRNQLDPPNRRSYDYDRKPEQPQQYHQSYDYQKKSEQPQQYMKALDNVFLQCYVQPFMILIFTARFIHRPRR